MTTCNCFACGKEFGSNNEDDIAGDGRCPKCKEVAIKAALKAEKIMAARRAADPHRFDNPHAAIIQDLMKNPDKRINIRELGITPNG